MRWPWQRRPIEPSEQEILERIQRERETEELRRRIDRIEAQVRVLRASADTSRRTA